MQTLQVLWGRKAHEEAWQESLITATADAQQLAAAKAWATQQGFTHLRISIDNGTAPDFVGTINL